MTFIAAHCVTYYDEVTYETIDVPAEMFKILVSEHDHTLEDKTHTV